MNSKLFQWFYNMPKLTNQDNKDYMAKISLNIAVSLFLFNLVAVLISFFIVTTTENYELSFNILAGALLIFTVYIVGGYSIYAKRKINRVVTHGNTHIVKNSFASAVYITLIIYLLNSLANTLSFHTSLISELKNPMSYIIPTVIGIIYGVLMALITWYRSK
ncbi:DUF3278 domain-containing protein [Limosilactobacillus reuteri]|uniref:DUF3278 domain-containing protein n=1 Tax=Limosilactobacillus reuteri TaxID=1598 RepID=A0A256VP81_LIMRT|nr:DUF3278 domain-containing protein [Limosilactobacillus reuteri]OYS60045.1 DUF3278 domain-containing protein [Limosilactobacillus reuteri]OYS60390.1 DUF3278 domain-containing protein [Limosilactobacillus reuteri]OYS65268.1 DUF3278 domain-containing protein [Limosilactobacillus reuteri]OYS74176.1 DUF3278 domain-containing protein [Limosilactobacillus reuteri]OYS76791.1 DUF3278 domain-containing protein [Limosilactobacillus reuteri]